MNYKELKNLILHEENNQLREFHLNILIKKYKRNLDRITKKIIKSDRNELEKDPSYKNEKLKTHYDVTNDKIYVACIYSFYNDNNEKVIDPDYYIYNFYNFLNEDYN